MAVERKVRNTGTTAKTTTKRKTSTPAKRPATVKGKSSTTTKKSTATKGRVTKSTGVATKMTDADLLKDMPPVKLPAVRKRTDITFMEQKDFFMARTDYVLSMELTSDNLERVKSLKKGIRGWRTQFSGIVKDRIALEFNAPKQVFQAAADEVLAEIKAMEDRVNAVLAKEDEKRIDGINTAIDGCIEDFIEDNDLPEDFGKDIIRDDKFYNKTAKIKDTISNVTAQLEKLVLDNKVKEANIKLIEAACAKHSALNPKIFLDMLDFEDSSVILVKIDEEIKRLNAQSKGTAGAIVSSSITIGSSSSAGVGFSVDTDALESDFKGLTKEMTLKIIYEIDMADELNRVFGKLREAGVKMKVLSAPAKDEPVI